MVLASSVHPEGSRTIVRYVGDCDGADGAGLLGPIVEALRDGPDVVVVDLARVGSLSPRCVDVLLEARSTASRFGAEIVLRHVSPGCRRQLEMAGVSTLFSIR